MSQDHQYILTLSCRDAKGIVHAVSGLLYQAGCNIIDSQQFGDLEGLDATGFFFMRVHFEAPPHLSSIATLDTLFAHARSQFGMDARFHAVAARPKLLLMVSQHGHCLNDLLFRWRRATASPSTTCRWRAAPRPRPSGRRSWRSRRSSSAKASTWWCWRATCRS